MRTSVPEASRRNRSGKAASISGVAVGKPAIGSSMLVRIQLALRVRSASGLKVAPSLSTRRWSAARPGLPPSTRVISTVRPVVKSKTGTLGVSRTGSPSWFRVGGPCSSVTEAIRSSLSTGDQLTPQFRVRSAPKSDSSSTSALKLAERSPSRSGPKRPRRTIGTSTLARAVAASRFRSVKVGAPSRRASLAKLRVEAPAMKVVETAPAGSWNRAPLTTAWASALSSRVRVRSRPNAASALSVRVSAVGVVVVGRHRPAPRRADVAVEREAEVGRLAVGLTAQHASVLWAVLGRVAEAEQAVGGGPVVAGVHGRRDLAEDVAVVGPVQRQGLGLGQQGAEGARVGGLGLDQVALALQQGGRVLVLDLEAEAAVAVDPQHVEVDVGLDAPAGGGDPGLGLRGRGAEAGAQHDVHHPLVGAVAVLQRHLLGQDVHAEDGFGRNGADLAEARDAPAVEQHDRVAFAAAPPALDLGGELLEQLGEVGGAVGADVAGIELDLGLDVADHRAGLARGGDHQLGEQGAVIVLGVGVVGLGLGRLGRRWLARRRRGLLGPDGGGGGARKQGEEERLGGTHVRPCLSRQCCSKLSGALGEAGQAHPYRRGEARFPSPLLNGRGAGLGCAHAGTAGPEVQSLAGRRGRAQRRRRAAPPGRHRGRAGLVPLLRGGRGHGAGGGAGVGGACDHHPGHRRGAGGLGRLRLLGRGTDRAAAADPHRAGGDHHGLSAARPDPRAAPAAAPARGGRLHGVELADRAGLRARLCGSGPGAPGRAFRGGDPEAPHRRRRRAGGLPHARRHGAAAGADHGLHARELDRADARRGAGAAQLDGLRPRRSDHRRRPLLGRQARAARRPPGRHARRLSDRRA